MDMSGVAKIKPEFIVEDHVKVLSMDCVNENDKRKLEAVDVEEDGSVKKKFKKNKQVLKGQNKARGPTFVTKPEDCFCPSLKDSTLQQTCIYGEKCKFVHDKNAFMKKKPEDINGQCYVFLEKGYCPMGIACRFGSSHLDDNGVNLINDDVQKKWKASSGNKTMNVLSHEVRHELRKHAYNFDRSEKICKENKASKDDKKETENCCKLNDKAKDGGESDVPKVDIAVESENIPSGSILDTDLVKIRKCELKKIDWNGKLYLSPLTTVGNLPYRRLCKKWGADITCSEMAVATELLKASPQEWALIKRHESEDLFGVQLCGNNPYVMTKCTQLLEEQMTVDFVDINLGCPIEFIYKQGSGSGLLQRTNVLQSVVTCMNQVSSLPITLKTRTGIHKDTNIIHNMMPKFKDWGASLITLHGRTREQRYTKQADWDYIEKCSQLCSPVPLFGNGDILSYEDYTESLKKSPSSSGVMIGRGALIKPWIFHEIKEKKLFDISSSERFDILKDYVNYGLEHWGSDTRGVETTRRFLLEWLSFLHRYIPVGLLEATQKMNQRPPIYHGRDDMENLMASSNCSDWIKISEMLLGKIPTGFSFLPKHKANSWK
uniref:tRNA-dihydrouridine(47) synthase [NAD(P)(+)] n=1 Tax=Cacopsylla melanoneura TaxID=428564 RepID=A0A8D8Y8L9_9HEMI